MKNLVVKANEVITYASRNVVMNGSDSLTATAKAVELATLKARLMRNEIVKIAYYKLDNTVRIALASLNPDICKARTNGNGIPKRYFNMFAYWDLEKMTGERLNSRDLSVALSVKRAMGRNPHPSNR